MAAYRVDVVGKSGCGNEMPKHDAMPVTSRESKPSAAMSTSAGTSTDCSNVVHGFRRRNEEVRARGERWGRGERNQRATSFL